MKPYYKDGTLKQVYFEPYKGMSRAVTDRFTPLKRYLANSRVTYSKYGLYIRDDWGDWAFVLIKGSDNCNHLDNKSRWKVARKSKPEV